MRDVLKVYSFCLYEGMGKYFTKILHQKYISYSPNLWGGLNVLISFLLFSQSLKVDLDKTVSQMPKCNINVFFFLLPFKRGKKNLQMRTADLVHHHNYLSSILLLVNEVGRNDSPVNDDWSLITVINQASQSFNSDLPPLYRRINARGWARTLGFSAWVSHSPLELRAWFSRQTHMSCHESICCAVVERP